MNMNQVVISGNITRDAEMRMAGEMPVLSFGLAVNDRVKNKQSGEWEDSPNFFDVKVFGKFAESITAKANKGARVVVNGRLKHSTWEAKDGGKRSKVEVIANNIEFIAKAEKQETHVPVEILGSEIPF